VVTLNYFDQSKTEQYRGIRQKIRPKVKKQKVLGQANSSLGNGPTIQEKQEEQPKIAQYEDDDDLWD
jgi:hypothetical protein